MKIKNKIRINLYFTTLLLLKACTIEINPTDENILEALVSTYTINKVEFKHEDSINSFELENTKNCELGLCNIDLKTIYKDTKITLELKNNSPEYKLAGKLKFLVHRISNTSLFEINISECSGKVLEPQNSCNIYLNYFFKDGSNFIEDIDDIKLEIIDERFIKKNYKSSKLNLNIIGHRKTKPILKFDYNFINFGTINHNEEKSASIKITNEGEVDIINSSLSFTNLNIKSFTIEHNSCENKECNYTIKFSIPQNLETGNILNTLKILLKDESNVAYNYNIPVSGYRKTPPQLIVEPELTQNYEELEQTISFTISNPGENILENFNFNLSNSINFRIEENSTCLNKTYIEQDQSCNINVKFKTGNISTNYSSTLNINSSARSSNINLEAYIKKPATLSFDPININFGNITQGNFSDTISLKLYHSDGERTASDISINFDNFENQFSIIENNCINISTLNINEYCIIKLKFTPQSNPISYSVSKNIIVNYKDGLDLNNKTTLAQLTGYAKTPANLSFSTDGFDFDKVFINHTNSNAGPKTYTITNTGDSPATNITFTNSNYASSFIRTNTCTNLNPLSSCTYTINFRPQIAGTIINNLSISAHNGVNIVNFGSVPFSGYGLNVPLINISSYNTNNDYGVLLYGDTIDADHEVEKYFIVQFSASYETSIIEINNVSTNNAYPNSNSSNQFFYTSGSYPGITGDVPAAYPRACTANNDTLGNNGTLSQNCIINISYKANRCAYSSGNVRLSYKIYDENIHGSNIYNKDAYSSVFFGRGRPPISFLQNYCNLTYLNRAVGSNETIEDSIINYTSHAINNLNLSDYESGQYVIDYTNCTNSLDSGATCTIRTKYNRIERFYHTNTLKINYELTQNTNISANGGTLGSTSYSVNLSNYNFGNVLLNNQVSTPLSITNSGYASIIITSNNFINSTLFTVSDNTCLNKELNIGQACTFTINFAPINTGTFSDNFRTILNLGTTVVNNTNTSNRTSTNTFYTYGTGFEIEEE